MKTSPFVWFPPESTAALRDKLNAAGDGAILEVHPHGDSAYYLYVRRAGASVGAVALDSPDDDPPINDSKLCPPICPS